jgi:hypothetical protein
MEGPDDAGYSLPNPDGHDRHRCASGCQESRARYIAYYPDGLMLAIGFCSALVYVAGLWLSFWYVRGGSPREVFEDGQSLEQKAEAESKEGGREIVF